MEKNLATLPTRKVVMNMNHVINKFSKNRGRLEMETPNYAQLQGHDVELKVIRNKRYQYETYRRHNK